MVILKLSFLQFLFLGFWGVAIGEDAACAERTGWSDRDTDLDVFDKNVLSMGEVD